MTFAPLTRRGFLQLAALIPALLAMLKLGTPAERGATWGATCCAPTGEGWALPWGIPWAIAPNPPPPDNIYLPVVEHER